MKRYQVNEMFGSCQGEGLRAGTANIFLRLSGCNMKCDIEPGPLSPGFFRCDTEFVSGRPMTANEIIFEARSLLPACKAIVLTGGEPTLQIDAELIDALKSQDYYLAIETNGTAEVLPGIDWITVSPKVAEHCIRQLTASEIKYVRHAGQGIPRPACKADYYLLSPASDNGVIDRESLAWCIKLVKENPSWRLSCQQHTQWKVR